MMEMIVKKLTRENIRSATFQLDVKGCARCGRDHPDMVFFRFKRPVDFDHPDIPVHDAWARCMHTGAPVIISCDSIPKMFIEDAGEEE